MLICKVHIRKSKFRCFGSASIYELRTMQDSFKHFRTWAKIYLKKNTYRENIWKFWWKFYRLYNFQTIIHRRRHHGMHRLRHRRALDNFSNCRFPPGSSASGLLCFYWFLESPIFSTLFDLCSLFSMRRRSHVRNVLTRNLK